MESNNSNVSISDRIDKPKEFYEILLFTKLNFNENCSIVDVFRGRVGEANPVPNEATPTPMEIENENLSSTKNPVHEISDIVEEFFNLPATYAFTRKDIEQLQHCYSVPHFSLEMLTNVCEGIWHYLTDMPQQNFVKYLIQFLYIRYCNNHNIELFLTEHECTTIVDRLRNEMQHLSISATPEMGNCQVGGRLSERSFFGEHWDQFSSNMDIKIMLHLIKICLEQSHVMGVFSLIINSRAWRENITTNAIVFMLNIFEKNRFICDDFDNYINPSIHQSSNPDQINISSTDVHIGEAPIKLLYLLVQYLYIEEHHTTLSSTIVRAFRFNFLTSVLLDGGTKRAEAVFTDFCAIVGIRCTGGGGGSRERVPNYRDMYSKILKMPIPMINFVIRHVIIMFKIQFYYMIYDTNEFVYDSLMPSAIYVHVPSITETEPSTFNFWYRRQTGIYNSFIGTTDAHSPALFSHINIRSPPFAISNIEILNMFDNHLSNRIFYLVMLGVHFCKYLCYQKLALILCGNIYSPHRIRSDGIDIPTRDGMEFTFKYAVSTIKICKDDMLTSLSFPPDMISALYKTKHLKYVYQWFYLIICEMSKVATIKVSHPSLYIFTEMDTSSGNIENSNFNFDINAENEDTVLTTLIAEKIYSSNQNGSSYDYSQHDNKWRQTMNFLPITHNGELDEILRNNIITKGGSEFELFILLIISWHIRMIHKTSYSNTKYMKYISDYREELYDEMTSVMATTIGPFFHSHDQGCLAAVFKNFSKYTHLTVDPLEFFLEPPRGFEIPGRSEGLDLGRIPHKFDDQIFSGVIAFIVQSQFNVQNIVDLLKVLTKISRPVNREQLVFALLNRPRTGKNTFINTLTDVVFPTTETNRYRYGDLIRCENNNIGNEFTVTFNRNLVVSFNEVNTLHKNLKTLSNNDCLIGRPIYQHTMAEFQIMATPIIAANSKPSISNHGMSGRIKVQDREFQYSSLNPAALFMRENSFHNCYLYEINSTFAVQMMLQILPKENKFVGEFGLYMIIWHMNRIFAYTQAEPCTSRWTRQMEKTNSRFIYAQDPARYILAHKLKPANDDPITVQVFKACLQKAIDEDKTIPPGNFKHTLRVVLDRLQNYIFTKNNVDYIKLKVRI